MAIDKSAKPRRVVLCKICGKPVEPCYGTDNRVYRKHTHDDCVIKEAIEAIVEGAPRDDKRKKRAQNAGFSLMEIRRELLNNGFSMRKVQQSLEE